MFPIAECPQSSRGQWTFEIFGVPVTVKPWFWFTVLIAGSSRELGGLLGWVVVCFVSILLHELGHVYAFRVFGAPAEVVLYGWGGLAIPHRGVRSTLGRFIVSLAGPAAGFCLAALTLLIARLAGWSVFFGWHTMLPSIAVFPAQAASVGGVPAVYNFYLLANDLLWVNFYWGLVNLLPVYPLDGGQATRAVFEQYDPLHGRRNSLILSAVASAGVAALGIMEHSNYIVLMFALLAAASLQSLDSERSRMWARTYRR